MRHKLDTAIYSQGWLEGQFESMVAKTAQTENEDPTAHLTAVQIQEQWSIVSETMDDLIAEYRALKIKLALVESALQ
jgi:hypothetical protein